MASIEQKQSLGKAKQNKKSVRPLTKEEKNAILKRMSEIKRYKNDPKTVQNTIPYLRMFKDGICQVTDNFYSKTIQFFDTNYTIADEEEQDSIFEKYCDILNFFDDSVKFQLTFENQNRPINDLVKEVRIPAKNDGFDDIRQEYSDMVESKLSSGTNVQPPRKFITFGVEASSAQVAKTKLMGIQASLVKMFNTLGTDPEPLNGKQRLETMFYSLNPFCNEQFIFDWNSMVKSGMDTKDFIAPSSLKFNKRDFEIGNAFGAVSCINILAGQLPDDILKSFLELQNLFCVNIHAEPFDQVSALKFIKRKLTNVEQMKIDEQKKATQSGYDPNILPLQIQMYIDDLEDLLEKLNSKNERLFHINISIRNYATDKKELEQQLALLKRTCQKCNCTLLPYDYIQEQCLGSTLPLAKNDFPVIRELHTSGIAVFVPFTTKELFQHGEATYYGVNAITGNMIRANRSNLKNPNGLVLGTPGSGKSFSVKREVFDVFFSGDDSIIIADPEGEYFPMVNRLKGQVINISANSDKYINPMDINFGVDLDENPISMKSDFIISLCEQIVGGKYGLTAEERSVIDRCVRKIYLDFLSNSPSPEKMPILSDLHKELICSGEIALRVANSLEMYVNGSQNLFNHRTNIDINNRLVCFDIKELNNQLKKVGMLIIQDQVWNRVTINRTRRQTTRYYIDEFHLLLREEQTAKYSVEIWKRFRKWGGIPTGITQNVKDLLSSPEIENIFDNSDFVIMLNQSAGDREILAEKLHISDELLKFVTNSAQGEGLIRYDKVLLPFRDVFPTDTTMYQLMTTKPKEQQLAQ